MSRTHDAVTSQLEAFGVPEYEVGVRRRDGSMLPRCWTAAVLIGAIAWLRLMNRKGCDIFIRPSGRLGLVLLDDLSEPAIQAMCRDGFPPAITTQTSPGNFQAWVRLVANTSRRPLPTTLLSEAAAELARRYRGDPNSADWRHYGRLAGFTNRKPCHCRNGLYPFVRLHRSTGEVAPAGRNLLCHLKVNATPNPLPSREPTARPATQTSYQQRFQAVLDANRDQIWTANPDLSRMDYMIAADMVRQGHSSHEIHRILADSPRLATRKAGHVTDYLNRTVRAAFGNPFSRPAR